MPKILLYPTHCEIQEESDIGFLWALDRELSFNVPGAKYSKAFKGFMNKDGQMIKWDGKHHCLTESLQFPLGLLQRVTEFFQKDNRNLTIEDCRPTKSTAAPIDIINRLSVLNKNPFPYQLEAVTAAKNHDYGIIRLATGGGKTIVAALIIAELGKKSIVYVIGKDLLYQIHQLFSSLFEQKIGIIGDGLCDIQDINIASIWTVGQAIGLNKTLLGVDGEDENNVDPQKYKDIRDMISTAKVHLFDECHVAACETIQEISKAINPEHIYGMSASPWRDDGKDKLIECLLGKNIINISASDLIDNNYLVPPIIKFIRVPEMSNTKNKHYQTIYKNYVVENQIRNGYVIKGTQSLVEQGYQTLVLYNSVAHGELLYQQLASKVPCILLSGKDDSITRNNAKEQLEKGTIKCIIASKIFDIGVDLPSLSGLVIASSGKSSVRALQRIGRVIRRYPGKKQAAILDFYDQAPFLKEHAIERRKIYSSERKFNIIWPS